MHDVNIMQYQKINYTKVTCYDNVLINLLKFSQSDVIKALIVFCVCISGDVQIIHPQTYVHNGKSNGTSIQHTAYLLFAYIYNTYYLRHNYLVQSFTMSSHVITINALRYNL